MSTLHHPDTHPHLWLYAAAAVAAGLLAVLMATVFASSSGSGPITPTGTGGGDVSSYHGPTFKEVCFAARPGSPIELVRSACQGAR